MKTSRRRYSPTPILLSALTLTAVLNTAGCFGGSGEEAPGSQPGTTQSTEPTVAAVPADVAVGTVSGRLTSAESKKAVTDLGGVVLQWFDAAYLAGDYPRDGGGNAFGTFTTGAADRAKHDGALMSNADVGARIESVAAKERRVRLDLLAVAHKVIGATARVALVFTTEGAFAKTVTVKGQLFLTPGDKGSWRIFGYKMARGEK